MDRVFKLRVHWYMKYN